MNKLKVLLTNAPVFNLDVFDVAHNKMRGYSLYPPVALTTIAAAVLDKITDIEIEILDLEFEIMKYFSENPESILSAREVLKQVLIDRINKYKPSLVGISVVFSISHSNAFSIADIVKSVNPKIRVCCGGNHATFAYQQMMSRCASIDNVFLYEADHTFVLFLQYLIGRTKFQDLRGMAYVDSGSTEIRISPYAPIIENLDSLPIPRWDLIPLKEYQKYGRIGAVNSFGDENKPTYIMQTVRGCMGACRFCSVRNFYGKGVRALSPQQVLKEIDYLYNDLGITQFEILDDDFTFNQQRTIDICDGMIDRNYKVVWNILNGVRLGTINDHIMDRLTRAGCRLISLGIESGNDSTLKAVGKPLSLKMLHEKMKIIKRYPQMYIKANYIIGFPFETKEETMNTFRLAEEMQCDWSCFSVFTPLPGTPLFQRLNKREREEFCFDYIRNDFQFDTIRNIARKFQPSQMILTGRSKSSIVELENRASGVNSISNEDLTELAYIKNLELNFIKNMNLNAGNIDRAIQDFEGIVRFIARDHAIAHYCLAKAYYKKENKELAKINFKKAMDILAQPKYYKWVQYFNKLVPTDELDELKTNLGL